mgnify:FL=1
MILLTKIKSINWQGIRESKLYRKFASLKTSIILLGLLVGFYIIGTIFPQGGHVDEYINASGRFISFVIFFDLLNIFTTPGFLIISLLLFVNLVICTFERFLVLWRQRTALAEEPLFTPSLMLPIDINPLLEDPAESIREILRKELGFREQASGSSSSSGTLVMEKGWSYRWLTWVYHLAILLCFLGFLLTYLFAFEDEITLYPEEATTVKPVKTNRWNKSWGGSPAELDFKLMLKEFITEYNQIPVLDYPVDRLSRLAVGMGWKDPKYILKDSSYFPKDWKSRLKITKGKQEILEKTIEVNDPLHFEGITFYQAAYKQDLKIQVDDNPILLETEVGKELIVPGIDGMFKFGTLKTGMLFKRDGSIEKIKPFIEVTLIKKDFSGKLAPEGLNRGTETEKLGKLEQNGSLFIENKQISLKEFKEASILTYRYDPGVPILWLAGILVLSAMSLRVFGAWYRIVYRVEEREGKAPHMLLNIKTKGLMADEAKLVRRLKYSLSDMAEPIDLDTPV